MTLREPDVGSNDTASEDQVAPPTIRVFGGMAVEVGGEPVSIGGARQRRLLALLVIRSGAVASLDWLAEHLWEDNERPDDMVSPLRTYVSRLRRSLPEHARAWLETEAAGYRLVAPEGAVDYEWAQSLRARAVRARDLGDPLTAHALLDEALALWRGEPFRELEDFDWARATIEQLGVDRLEMMEERWEALLALGRHTQITGELAAFTSQHGLRDRAVRQHALALHRSGRTAEGLRVIEALKRELAEVSGLDPSPGLLEL
ncbi:MAG: AfsR/SARP family transcriptional regulator, partial [Acidimicrobiales bacterium]